MPDASLYDDGRYAYRNPDWHTEDSAWKAQQILALLQRQQLQPASVAEVGCGAGEVLRQVFLGLGGQTPCDGFDISSHAIARATPRACPGLRYHHADLLEIAADRVDLMLAVDVFEHVEDYLGFLRRLRPLARWTVFHIPLDLSVQTVARSAPLAIAREAVGHLHYFTRETALASLQHAGYEVVASCYTAGALERPARHW